MTSYLVTKDIPVTWQVEADSASEAEKEIETDCPLIYRVIQSAVENASNTRTTNPAWVGDWYDDTNVELDTLDD